MKWQSIKIGSKRIRKKFAYFPTKCDNGSTVWLERYFQLEIRWNDNLMVLLALGTWTNWEVCGKFPISISKNILTNRYQNKIGSIEEWKNAEGYSELSNISNENQ